MLSGNKGKLVGSKKINSLVGQETKIVGDLSFSGGVHIEGSVKGNIIADLNSDAVLTIGSKARVEGKISVPCVLVNGKIVGDVHASKQIELGDKAKVHGNVYYSVIEMARGAEVNGKLVHNQSLKDVDKVVIKTKVDSGDKQPEINEKTQIEQQLKPSGS